MDAAHECFMQLLEEHRNILYKVSSAYCANAEDRRDLIQEMVIQLWRSFDRFDSSYRFSTWMYRIALNVAISFYRSERRRSGRSVSLEASLLELAAPEPESDDVQLLRQFIGELEPLNKALMLLYLDGYSYEEIGEMLGISASNGATKLSRLKQRLRLQFQEHYQDYQS